MGSCGWRGDGDGGPGGGSRGCGVVPGPARGRRELIDAVCQLSRLDARQYAKSPSTSGNSDIASLGYWGCEHPGARVRMGNTIRVVGRDDETPFARVPEPVAEPYEMSSPVTYEQQIAGYGKFASGLRRRSPLVRFGAALVIVMLIGTLLAVLISSVISN